MNRMAQSQSDANPAFRIISQPLLMVLSGPSGVGKDAVLKAMKLKGYPLHYAITMTTRTRRPNEVEGVDYHFTSEARFRQLMDAGELLEWAQVYGNYYGVPRPQIRQAMAQGHDVLLKIDVQGAATIRRLVPEVVLIFLMPPSFEELQDRLVCRDTDTARDLERRLAAARTEMNCLDLFDYVVVNRSHALDEAAAQVMAIVTAEKCRARPRMACV
jgi:guanylate kinase